MMDSVWKLIQNEDLDYVLQGLELLDSCIDNAQEVYDLLQIPPEIQDLQSLFLWAGGQCRHPLFLALWSGGTLAKFQEPWASKKLSLRLNFSSKKKSLKNRCFDGLFEIPEQAKYLQINELTLHGYHKRLPKQFAFLNAQRLLLTQCSISHLDLSEFTKLEYLNISHSSIKKINPPKDSSLLKTVVAHECDWMKKTNFFSHLTALEILDCRRNQTLNLSKMLFKESIEFTMQTSNPPFIISNPAFPLTPSYAPLSSSPPPSTITSSSSRPPPLPPQNSVSHAPNSGTSIFTKRSKSPQDFARKEKEELEAAWGWIRNCPNIRELYLPNGVLTSLPEAFQALIQLHTLDLSFHRLKAVDAIGQLLPSLKTLNLSGNEGCQLEGLCDLHYLENLILMHCHLKNVPASLQNIENLQVLHLADNQIDTVPEFVWNLQQVDLWNNFLSQECCHRLFFEGKWPSVSMKWLQKYPENPENALWRSQQYNHEIQKQMKLHPNLEQLQKHFRYYQKWGVNSTEEQLAFERLLETEKFLNTYLKMWYSKPTKSIQGSSNTEIRCEIQAHPKARKWYENGQVWTLINGQEHLLGISNIEPFLQAMDDKSVVIKLNLSGFQGSKLPKVVLECHHLQYLNLSGSRIKKLPRKLLDLPLQHINCQNTAIKKLPKAFLKRCTQLEFTHGSITSSFLQGLNLQNTSLFYHAFRHVCSQVADGVLSASSFVELDFSQSTLTALPENISALYFLQRLDISNTKISHLPKSLSELEHLRSLTFHNTAISTLPTGLTALLLNREQFKQFRTVLPKLTNLRWLTLQDCALTEFPTELLSLQKLHTLDLRCNFITSLPTTICTMVNLRTLMLRQNQIADIEEGYSFPPSLALLDLRSNPLKKLPKSIQYCESLQVKMSR